MSKLIPYLLILPLLLISLAAATHLDSAPAVYFTDNVASTGITTTVTAIEQSLLTQINRATTTIDAAFYDFDRIALRDALLAAKQRNVKIRIVADGEARANPSYAPNFEALKAAGITIVDDGNLQASALDAGPIMHDKYFVFDKAKVWTGSTNLSDNDLTKNHNNAIVITDTQLATAYLHDFEQMFAGNFTAAKTASPTTTFTIDGQRAELYFSPQDSALTAIISQVHSATTSIDFAIFFYTEQALADAMIAAHQRGVAIRGLYDQLGAGNSFSRDETLCAAGIPGKIENTLGKMHHKLMIIDAATDHPRVVTGSLNWTQAGAQKNSENTLILHHPAIVQQYASHYQQLWAAINSGNQCNISEERRAYLPLITRAIDPTTALRITRIVYDPDGADLAGERLEITNIGPDPIDLNGWSLSDAANQRYMFSTTLLPPSTVLTLWVKTGVDTSSELYWNRNAPLWNNDSDTATLTSPSGEPIDTCEYVGDFSETTCADDNSL